MYLPSCHDNIPLQKMSAVAIYEVWEKLHSTTRWENVTMIGEDVMVVRRTTTILLSTVGETRGRLKCCRRREVVRYREGVETVLLFESLQS